MIAQGLVWPILLIATYCDVRERRIPNWLVGAGLSAACVLSLVADGILWFTGGARSASWFSYLSLTEAILGLLITGILPLLLYITAGGGAGDVKLAWALGALLGWRYGGLAILVAYLFSGAWGLIWLILSGRLWTLCLRPFRNIAARLWPHWVTSAAEIPLDIRSATLAMSPFIAIGVLLVLLEGMPS